MTSAYRGTRSPWVLLLLLLAGAVAGSAFNGAVAGIIPVLASSAQIGIRDFTLDLHFMRLTFGFIIDLSPLTALGMVLGYLVYRKI